MKVGAESMQHSQESVRAIIMGIHPDHPEHTAAIVNGVPLEYHSYDEPGSSRETVTKYVQARANTLIEAKSHVPASLFAQHGVKLTLQIDGEDMRRSVLDKESYVSTGWTGRVKRSIAHVDGQ